MKKLTLALFFVCLINVAFAQKKDLTAIADSIEKEGKILYQSEMASWYGSDIFLEKCKSKSARIGGYISYDTGKGLNNVFFSKDDDPVVLGTMSFGYDITPANCNIDTIERKFTRNEMELYAIQQQIVGNMKTNKGTLFKFYRNTSLNPVPIITKSYRRVYVLTGPKANNVIIFGNDYLFDFNEKSKLISSKILHKNIIPINFSRADSSVASIHSHLPSTGDFVTATDICTLMLYEGTLIGKHIM